MGYFDHDQYIELTLHFHCNLKCAHCMIEGTMNWLKPVDESQFEEILALNARERRWTGIIFTGAEVTLRKDLPDLARRAREHGFQNVRIQTHGMKLADPAYCETLVAAGINEYFVSVIAGDAATHDAISGVPGSFERTVRGMENLDRIPGVVMHTNTVITRRSVAHLSGVVEALAHLKNLVQMEFWNYWPMSESDSKDLVASNQEILPHLKRAIVRARELGREVEVKNFPECLLGEERAALNNHQPKLIIDPAFWTEFSRNGFHQCAHRSTCRSEQCLGLNTAYVKRYGWEAETLTPLPS